MDAKTSCSTWFSNSLRAQHEAHHHASPRNNVLSHGEMCRYPQNVLIVASLEQHPPPGAQHHLMLIKHEAMMINYEKIPIPRSG